MGGAEGSESACGAPACLGDSRRDIRSSCVSELTSALQALEVGVLQDAVDLLIGHQARRAGQLRGVAVVEGTAGASGTLTATAASRMPWTAAALAD